MQCCCLCSFHRINQIGNDLRDQIQPATEHHPVNQTTTRSASSSLYFTHLQGQWLHSLSGQPILIILSVDKFLLMSNLQLLWCSLRPWDYFERKTGKSNVDKQERHANKQTRQGRFLFLMGSLQILVPPKKKIKNIVWLSTFCLKYCYKTCNLLI